MSKKRTKEEFVVDAKKVHGDKYGYVDVDYVNNTTKVKIICSTYSEFEQIVDIEESYFFFRKDGYIKIFNLVI